MQQHFIMSPSNINLRSILEANKLTGSNYIDWLRNVKIILRGEKLAYVIEIPVPPIPAANTPAEEHAVHRKHSEDMDVACCIMLASISPERQK